MLRASIKLTYPLWLMAHVFQSERLRQIFLKLSDRSLEDISSTDHGLIPVKEISVKGIESSQFEKLIYNKQPLLIKGLAYEHYQKSKITHQYLKDHFPNFKTSPRIGDNNLGKEQTITDILSHPENKQTIASSELAAKELLRRDINIQNWIPSQKILNSPLLNNTLFVSSKGFYTRLHMEAGRLLNIQLSGKKTWYLIDPKYSHLLSPLLSDTTIHFSDIVKEISDIEDKLAQKIPIYKCTLSPGDVLLIPPFHWHTVFCKEDGVSSTYQWMTLFRPFLENPFLSLFLLTSRKPSVFDILFKRGKK